jgi:hypothetical protein
MSIIKAYISIEELTKSINNKRLTSMRSIMVRMTFPSVIPRF